mmetsp:Transcript_28007/g.41668  ORF Transcript_28007/g.41668 Transcript_28007/m.41668 type:complete len:468 (-) Transcript_28007:279-1682(-)
MKTTTSISHLARLFVLLALSHVVIEAFTFTTVQPTTKRLIFSNSFLNDRRRRHYPSVRLSTEDEVEKSTTSSSKTTTTDPPSPPPQTTSLESPTTNEEDISSHLLAEGKEIYESLALALQYITQKDDSVSAEDIVKICDEIDTIRTPNTNDAERKNLFAVSTLNIRMNALTASRYQLLIKMLKTNYDAYVATASFLSPSRIPRSELPNVQDVPMLEQPIMPESILDEDDGKTELVADCTLEDLRYQESLLDKILLKVFRSFVEKNTNGVSSPKEGIEGLLDQGRTYMLQPTTTPKDQQKMVYNTLGGLMTPVLPPFYRIFMSGIVPKLGTDYDGKQFGPWFYAPWLTSFVTPTFFGFLVGPSKTNRRKDGMPGGLVVEKCKFLQESGCKGMCLNICKLPAQDFFKEELGLPLTVSPNFVTQECQWSFGEEPLPPSKDPSFPKGCLAGCDSRKIMAERGLSSGQLVCE